VGFQKFKNGALLTKLGFLLCINKVVKKLAGVVFLAVSLLHE